MWLFKGGLGQEECREFSPFFFNRGCVPLGSLSWVTQRDKKHLSKETYIYVKRDIHICQKIPIYICLLTESHSFSLEREWQIRPVKRDLHIRQKSHTYMSKDTYIYMCLDRELLFLSLESYKRDLSQETYIYVKRDIHIRQKTPMYIYVSWQRVTLSLERESDKRDLSQETYSDKRDLSKKTYTYIKRDIHICQKTPMYIRLLTESHSFSLESYKRDLSKEIYIKRHTYTSKDTYIYMSLDRESLFLSRERVTKETCQKRLTVTKETCQKRHTYRSKETYIYVKRHLYIYFSWQRVTLSLSRVTKETCQKRPAYTSKETYK